jgi:aminocarboxymuconate-semialdehyde decarboxylase
VIADFHIHLVPGVATSQPAETRFEHGVPVSTQHGLLGDEGALVEMLDAARIDVALLSSGRGLRGDPAEAARANADLAAVVERHPGRLRSLWHVGRPGEGWLDAADRWLDRCPGAAIPSRFDGIELDDERLEPLYSTLERRRKFLWVHPALSPSQAELGVYDAYDLYRTVGREFSLATASVRLILGGVLDRHPRLEIVMSHLGGGVAMLLPRIDHYQDKAMWGVSADPRHGRRPERPPSEYIERMWFDTGGFFADPAVIDAALTRIPPSQIVLGSDYPQEVRSPEPVCRLVADLRRRGMAGNGTDLVSGR